MKLLLVKNCWPDCVNSHSLGQWALEDREEVLKLLCKKPGEFLPAPWSQNRGSERALIVCWSQYLYVLGT